MSEKRSTASELIINELITQAKAGDKEALESLVSFIQVKVYNLSLRMLQRPVDAEDAAQEILIKIITHLSEFRGESAFTTWAYRLATNYLLTTRQHQAEQYHLTFGSLGAMIDASLAQAESDFTEHVEQEALIEEVKLNCTLGMLLCLDREQRIILILAEMFQVDSQEGAYILDITPVAFRKRLSRARASVVDFVSHKCGIVNPANPCRCEKHIENKIRKGLLDPNQLLYAKRGDEGSQQQALLAQRQELNELRRTGALFRSHPNYAPSGTFLEAVKQLVKNGHLEPFN